MSWIERPKQKSKNPSAKFLEWASDDKCFRYYDKEKKENVLVPLPLKIVILEHYHTVKGWSDSAESGIYANEVFAIGTDPLRVKTYDGGKIASGLYKEIKEQVNRSGGHYARSIYAVTNDQEIINISLKGSGVSAYSDFIRKFGDHNFDKHWIEVNEAQELKKGKVSYSIPVFTKGAKITKREALEPFAEELQSYMLDYMDDTPVINAPSTQEMPPAEVYEAEVEDDGMPF